jgi:predicted Zn-dependent protease
MTIHRHIILLLSTFTLLACATSPTQRRQIVLFSDAEMSAQGSEYYNQMRREMPISANTAQTNFVQCVTNHLIASLQPAQRGNHVWEVTLFENQQANALALPGGKMGVYSGLLTVAVNQHQLAAVMAHEIGHVLARHSNERASQAALIGIGRAVVQASGASNATLSALDLGTELGLFLPFNRAQESEGDNIGVTLMAQAGFDPWGSVALWENMARLGGSRQPEFMSTHPSPATRIADLTRLMPQAELLMESVRAASRVPNCQSNF